MKLETYIYFYHLFNLLWIISLIFATFSEFARLMLPVIPLIIFSYIKLYQKAPISMSLTIILSYFFSIYFIKHIRNRTKICINITIYKYEMRYNNAC